MKFSDTSNLTGLVEDVDFNCSTDANSYTLKDKTRNINKWYYTVVSWIWSASGTWEFDDSNLTDLPIATTDLIDAQQDYTLPTDLFKLERVEILNSNGDYEKLRPIDQSEIKVALSEYQQTDGLPKEYDIIGNSIFLYPAPATSEVTLSAGLKLVFAREVDEFVSTDTTQEPGFAEPFHQILSYGASYIWMLVNAPTKAPPILGEINRLRAELVEFYGDKDRDMKPKLKPRIERME